MNCFSPPRRLRRMECIRCAGLYCHRHLSRKKLSKPPSPLKGELVRHFCRDIPVIESQIGNLLKIACRIFWIDGVKLMILNDLHLFLPFFSARAYALAELVRTRAFRPLESSFSMDSDSGIFRIYKDHFSNIKFDICKDKSFFHLRYKSTNLLCWPKIHTKIMDNVCSFVDV